MFGVFFVGWLIIVALLIAALVSFGGLGTFLIVLLATVIYWSVAGMLIH